MSVDLEDWRLLPDGRYSVSSLGNVITHINRTHLERRQTAPMRQCLDKDGYRYLRLAGAKWLVHRLVYATFTGPLVDGLVVCHLDGDKTNNAVGNLKQATQQENIAHKVAHGTHQVGQKHGRALCSDAKAAEVRAAIAAAPKSATGRLKRGVRAEISKALGVSPHLIADMASGKSWRHI